MSSERGAHPYDDFLEEVERPSRYVGGEFRPFEAPRAEGEAHVVLAFPDTYEIGMSHQGTAILLDILERSEGVRADRVFAPWPDMEAALRSRGLPLLTLDEGVPAGHADLVGFSLQHELSFTNVLTILDLSGIPLRASERGVDSPVVVGGGPVASHAEPVAPFFDLFVIGEGEDVLVPLARDVARLRREGWPREAMLRELAQRHSGVYAPGLARREMSARGLRVPVAAEVREGTPPLPWPVRKNVVSLAAHPYPRALMVPTSEAVFDRFAVEVARGCQQGCRFCQAGILYRPARERDAAEVAGAILEGARCGGQEEVSLSSLSTADYGALEPVLEGLMESLTPRRVALSVSSLRAYGLSDGVLRRIASVRKTGLTLAPEAGTERLRRVINKNVSDEELLSAVRRAAARGWRRVKLYFMCALPSETDEDLVGIVSLARRVREAPRYGGRGKPVDVTVSVSNHVPKPHCPFQWEATVSREELRRKHRVLMDAVRGTGLKLRFHDPATSWLEAVLGRGDVRLAEVIEEAWRQGARFDGWDERLRFDLWEQAFAATGVEPSVYLAAGEQDDPLPWDYADVLVSKRWLWRERERAYEERPSPACGLFDTATTEGRAYCEACGAGCDPSQRRSEVGVRDAVMAEVASARKPPETLVVGSDELVRYRLRYERRGSARFLGHLELGRHLIRTFRRAGLRIGYSAGFHPHSLVTFPPPLPVGAEGLDERVDLLAGPEDRDDGALLAALDAASIRGVRWLGVERVAKDTPKISRLVVEAEHVLRLAPAALGQALGVSPDEAEAVLWHLAENWVAVEGPLLVQTRRKEGEREVDLRPALRAVGGEEIVGPVREALDPQGQWALVGLRLAIHEPGGLTRPADWLRSLVPAYEGPIRAARTRLIDPSQGAV